MRLLHQDANKLPHVPSHCSGLARQRPHRRPRQGNRATRLSREKLTAFLRGNAPNCLCDECIARRLGHAPKQVRQLTRDLGSTGLFTQGHGTCSSCRKAKIVTQPITRPA